MALILCHKLTITIVITKLMQFSLQALQRNLNNILLNYQEIKLTDLI